MFRGRRRTPQVLIVLTLLWAMPVPTAVAEGWHHNLDQARADAERLNRPILCHFYADWCLPCQKMEHSVLNQSAVRQLLRDSVVGLKINIDRTPELARRFAVNQFPTDLLIEPTGQQLLKSTGYRPTSEYIAMIQRGRTRYADLLASRQKPEEKRSAPPAVTRKTPDRSKLTSHQTEPMLDGYCPVTLSTNRRWVAGSPQYKGEYNGQVFLMASRELQEQFIADPNRYAPQLLGCDPVIVWETDRAVRGDTRFGAFYDERLYLFSSNENRQRFKENPDRFIRTEVVLHLEDVERSIR